jgi:hypothetical protein
METAEQMLDLLGLFRRIENVDQLCVGSKPRVGCEGSHLETEKFQCLVERDDDRDPRSRDRLSDRMNDRRSDALPCLPWGGTALKADALASTGSAG